MFVSRYDLQPSPSKDPANMPEATSAILPPVVIATESAASPTPAVPEASERTSFRSRLRELRAAHSGPDYIAALRRLHHDHLNGRAHATPIYRNAS